MTAAGVGGVTIGSGIGYALSKLSSTDLRQLLEKFVDGFFEFLKNQGPYTAFVLMVAVVHTVLFIWAVNKLIKAKEEEIDRLVKERDRFQKPYITHWQTSQKGKKK
jgi:cytochrome b subunit of formate dehydrogenase